MDKRLTTSRALAARVSVLLVALLMVPFLAQAQDTAGVGAVRGTVVAANGTPAAEVGVCIQQLGRCVVSDTRGSFAITDLRPDRYDVEVVATGRPPIVTPVTIRAGIDALLEVTLPEPTAIEETVIVSAPVFVVREEVKTSGFLASGTDVAVNAGGLQDVARYVQTLPGASIGANDFRNDLIVRGGSPLENLYIVDNVEIPNINTFANFSSAGGTVSMIDSTLLEDVTFLTGGYPSVYGNRASSVLQMSLREGSRERTTGRVTFGFAGAGGSAEGPLASGRGSWIVSARRSVLDLVTEDTGIGGVPVLYTLNGKLLFDLTPRDRVWLLNISGFDRIRLGANENSDLTSELSNVDITYRGRRQATGFNWQRTFGSRGVGLLGATFSRASVQQRVGDLIRNGVPPASISLDQQIASAAEVFRERSSESDLALKYDLSLAAGLLGKLQAGAFVRRSFIDYDAASPFGNESPFFVQAQSNPFSVREQKATWNSGGYAQLSRRFGQRTDLTAGVRGDRYGYLPAFRLAPRLGASYELTPTLSLRAAAGRYYQQPFQVFVTAFPQNRTLDVFYADHAVAGVSLSDGRASRLTVEGYVKQYHRYPVSSTVPQLSLANVGDTFAVRDVLFPMTSVGEGKAMGVELFAERKAQPDARWFGQANLAISSSRYTAKDGIWRSGDFDYPIIANAVGTYRISDRWDVGTRMSFLSGRPYTPIDVTLSADSRRAIYDLSRVNAERAPAYFRLDLRVDRHFTINGKTVTVFAGAQNITNRKNFSGYTWDRRNGGIRKQEQLGLFPIIGLDWPF